MATNQVNSTVTHDEGDAKENEAKQYFITNEKFNLLKQCQQEIFKATDVSPTLRKLVNELITNENLEKVAAKLISQLQ